MASSTLTEPDVVVRTFFDALVAGSTRAATDLLADDAYWQNVGLPTLVGKRAVARGIRTMHRSCRFGVVVHHLAVGAPADPTDPSAPTIVLTERTDTLAFGPFAMDFWVCGRLEVRDGLVCGWKDYFSTTDMARGAVRGALRMIPFVGR